MGYENEIKVTTIPKREILQTDNKAGLICLNQGLSTWVAGENV
jgi:hypothetical protein